MERKTRWKLVEKLNLCWFKPKKWQWDISPYSVALFVRGMMNMSDKIEECWDYNDVWEWKNSCWLLCWAALCADEDRLWTDNGSASFLKMIEMLDLYLCGHLLSKNHQTVTAQNDTTMPEDRPGLYNNINNNYNNNIIYILLL